MSDKVYTSSFSGAQIDEAVDKVINGDIEGSNIKEGSIPLSALADKLQAELNCKYGLSEIVCILNSNNTTSDIFPIGDYFVYVSSKKTIIELNIGGRTDLSRLNGPYTVITSEVISGSKVKFSVSGGDISYYGNLIIGNKYNEVPTPTPDWNAQEGEAGYIENRTHFAKYIPIPKDASVVIDVPCTYDHDRGVHYLLKDIVVEYKYYYMTEYNKVIIPAGTDINGSVYVEAEAGGGPVTLEFSLTYDNGVVNIRIIRAPNYDFRVVIYNMLDDIYLPDTVLKTTPQKLSDTDKNQALANLGIADLLEALKPVELLSDSEFPTGDNVSQEDLDYIGLTRTVIDNIINGITTKVNYNGTLSDVTGVYKWNTGFKFSLIFIEDPQIIETETGIISTFFSASSYNVKYNGTNYKCSMSGF